MQSHNFVPASARQATRWHLGSDVPSTGLVHTSFRVKLHEVPRWLHLNKEGGGRDPVEGYTGVGYDFTYTRYNRETGVAYKYTGHLHSVSIDKASFAERTLADAYWQVVETQKGRRAVITFWWCDKGGHVNQETTKHEAALRSLFGELADVVWDYMEEYDNPSSEALKCSANLALVFKGASKGKPVQHVIGIDDEPLSEVDVSLVDNAQAVDVPQVDAVDPMKYLTTLATLGSMVEEDTAARTLPGTGKSELSTALAEKLGALLGKK